MNLKGEISIFFGQKQNVVCNVVIIPILVYNYPFLAMSLVVVLQPIFKWYILDWHTDLSSIILCLGLGKFWVRCLSGV